ncbi:MAG TPA: aminoacetone oxidase family FAD-binding enzyme, partial [Bacteroidetes bacterium]|nr:aminoacetone oxidase family FAD-binding enzyme [Bacteroidota bacterium]
TLFRSGLFCASLSGKKGKKVLILEKSEKVGKKILISGGGRCNFTNVHTKPENFISQNPHFCKSALARFSPGDFISLVEKYKIGYHEKKLGQLFCNNSSRDIVDMLLTECSISNVKIKTNCEVTEIKKSDNFYIKTNSDEYSSDSLVIATGGISIPKMGATDFGYNIAKQFELKLTDISPGLVPFVLNNNPFSEISGISIDCIVTIDKTSFRENILFTHKGLSGPAILQISNYWHHGKIISINLLPDLNIEEILNQNISSKKELLNFLSDYLPKRFVEIFFIKYFKSKSVNKLTVEEIQKLSSLIHSFKIKPDTTEGFEKAEVTRGGVDTNEISSKSMESKKVPGLFFIGEVLDVTGWLGGYNFQWAWASASACSETV